MTSPMNTLQNGRPVHKLAGDLLSRSVGVHLVGCGGTGSQMLTLLARLHVGMIALGHPAGLHVTVFDPDTVTPSNIGRQLFSRSDLGKNKADVLVQRINAYYCTTWLAMPGRYEVLGCHPQGPRCDILITCVDTARTRREIAQELAGQVWKAPYYWLDLGNTLRMGQVMLTELRYPVALQTIGSDEGASAMGWGTKERTDAVLPPLWVMLPEIFDPAYVEDNRPSCSLAESLAEQGLFINGHMAFWGANLLEQLFRQTQIDIHGYHINLDADVPVRAQPIWAPQRAAGGVVTAKGVGIHG